MKFKLMFEPRDLWIGCFWDRRSEDDATGVRPDGTVWQTAVGMDRLQRIRTVLYFCLIPTVVLKVTL